ncbi:MAG: tetratricopeptide repeat protein [Gemmatimonadota bacterium]
MATSARLDELKKKFDENPRRYFAPLANEYRKLGDLTQAIALCRAHLPNQPGHISGHIVLAQALYEARELGESRQIFEASLDLDPENLIALRYLGDIAREQGEPMQARGWYERVLDADPRNDEIALLLKELDESSGSVDLGEESRVPALEDLAPPPISGYESPAFTSSGSVEGSPPIDPFVDESASETPFWRRAAVAHPPDDFSEPEEILHDLPAADAPLSFFESTTSDDAFASSDDSTASDPFFGAAEGAGTLEVNEFPAASAASRVDDWFASAATSPEHESVEELPADQSSRFEDSFLPDLSAVTPIDSHTVDAVSDPEAAPSFVDEQSPEFSTDTFLQPADATPVSAPASPISGIPTPPFLSVVDDDAPDAPALQAERPEPSYDDSVESGLSYDKPNEDDRVADSFEPLPFAELREAPTVEDEPLVTRRASSDFDTHFHEGGEREEPTLEVDVTSALPEPAAVNHVEAHFASESDPLYEGQDGDERDDAFSDEAVEAVEAVEASAAEGDFVLEYGEFVPPARDDTAFIATAISDPFGDEDSPFSPPAFEDAVESSDAETDEDEREEESLVSAVQDPWSDADDVAPVEGLISREVAAVPDPEVEAASALEVAEPESPAFVTETMAELYLQQGFNDEALAIYRQLLAQQPDDISLQDRIAAIERGAPSTVVDGVAPRDVIDRAGQSVRHFFAHFARRTPNARGPDEPGSEGAHSQVSGDSTSGESDGRTAGAANRDEALTVPDAAPGAVSLSQLFSAGIVSGADEHAATALSSAFGGNEVAPASRTAERELSLEHLFRDVPAHSSGAVTLDEFYEGSSPEGANPTDRDAADGEEHGADIEQFTAWLEGLKKK